MWTTITALTKPAPLATELDTPRSLSAMPNGQSGWYPAGLTETASSVMSALSVASRDGGNTSRSASVQGRPHAGTNSLDLASELGYSDQGAQNQTRNPRLIETLVYGNKDPLAAGFRTPTIRDIPQLALPKLHVPDKTTFEEYLQDVDCEDELNDSELESAVALASEIPGNLGASDILVAHSLETVPKVFFETDFDLDNPRIFNSICGDAQSFESSASDEALDSAMLQEKLSWCIDCIELHLISEIAQASGTFFSITSQLSALKQDSQAVTKSVKELGNVLDDTQVEVVDFAKDTLGNLQQLESTQSLLDGVKQLQHLLEAVGNLETTLSDGKHSEALEALPHVRLLANGGTDTETGAELLCLADMPALVPTLIRLNELEAKIGEQFRLELIALLEQDIRRTLENTPAKAVLDRLSQVLQPRQANTAALPVISTDDLRSELQVVLRGSKHVGILDPTLKSCKDESLAIVKKILDEQLPNGLKTGNSTQISVATRQLSYEEMEQMLRNVYVILSVVLKRVSTQQKLLLDLASALGPPPLELLAITENAARFCDLRIARILSNRSEQNYSASLRNFLGQYALTGMFMSDCETTCGIYPPELSRQLQQDIKMYVSNLQQSQMTHMLESLNMSSWRKERVPASSQFRINRIVESATVDPAEWLRLWKTIVDGESYFDNQGDQDQSSPSAQVERESFNVSAALLKLTQFIEVDLQLLTLLPQTAQNMAKLLLALLNQFNERSRALVLGAEAMRSGSGLKRITFRQLSQASEDIGFISGLIPVLSKCLERHLTTDRVPILEELELLLGNFTVHQEDIHQKFVSLMRDKIVLYCSSIAATDFSAEAVPANTYMQNMVKDLTTVARILDEAITSRSTVEKVMTQIFNVYKPRLLESFTSVKLKSPLHKENLLTDIDFFKKKLENTAGAGNVGEILYLTIDQFSITESAPTPRQSIEASSRRSTEARRSIEAKKPSEIPNISVTKSTDSLGTDFGSDPPVSEARSLSPSPSQPGNGNITIGAEDGDCTTEANTSQNVLDEASRDPQAESSTADSVDITKPILSEVIAPVISESSGATDSPESKAPEAPADQTSNETDSQLLAEPTNSREAESKAPTAAATKMAAKVTAEAESEVPAEVETVQNDNETVEQESDSNLETTGPSEDRKADSEADSLADAETHVEKSVSATDSESTADAGIVIEAQDSVKAGEKSSAESDSGGNDEGGSEPITLAEPVSSEPEHLPSTVQSDKPEALDEASKETLNTISEPEN